MMKKIMWGISFFSLIGTAAVIRFMPESIPMHYDLAGNIDRWGSRNESLIFPIIILIMYLFWHLFILYFEKKALKAKDEKESAAAESNAKVLGIVGISMAAMFTVMNGFMLYSSYTAAMIGAEKQTMDIGKVSVFLTGIVLIVVGNFMTKTRNNGAVGFRISWSMYNDNTWRKSNRFAAVALMAAGVMTILSSVFAKSAAGATVLEIVYICLAAVVSTVYAHKVYVEEKRSEEKKEGEV